MNAYLKDLNEVQRQAVTKIEGASLVIAGAGSGKTRVLTYRIAYILSNNVDPRAILSLTFTNKAAKEMKERIATVVGFEAARKLWMGTFHSIFSRILRREAEHLGFTSNFTIYDTQDSRNLIKTIIRELKLDDKQYKPAEIGNRISSAKNNLITAQAYAANPQFIQTDVSNQRPRMADIYRMYVNRCKRADAMDFDDLLLNTNILFRDFPSVLEKYQNTFRYILVDEYQDTNFAQSKIISRLSEKHQNVCVVGDDAQSIYAFRGAKIENILNFKTQYPGYTLFKLEQNYRSTQTIVDAANSLIAKNKSQIKKNVFSKNDTGNKIQILEASTDNEEGFIVANAIKDTLHLKREKYSEFAVLYRTNAQSRIFEEALRKKNIPYKVYGSLSFYQRKEIKDFLSYLRIIVNPKDDEALKRIINYPARGIGKTTLTKLEEKSAGLDANLWEILKNPLKYKVDLNKGTLQKISTFVDMMREFQGMVLKTEAYELAMQVASRSGILNDLHFENTPENISRYENIQELLNSIREFSDSQEEGQDATLPAYLENVALLTDADNENEEDFNKVSIMTIHAAKGLEFGYVFITGVEEDLFPGRMSVTTLQGLEEERRLFYVALTRAKVQASISFANLRYKWGVAEGCRPSRFIGEIDAHFLDVPVETEEPATSPAAGATANFRGSAKRKNTNGNFKTPPPPAFPPPGKFRKVQQQPAAGNPFKGDSADSIKNGMMVEHQRFGKGKVINLEGDAPNIKATVFFQSAGQKQLLLKFARLKIIG